MEMEQRDWRRIIQTLGPPLREKLGNNSLYEGGKKGEKGEEGGRGKRKEKME